MNKTIAIASLLIIGVILVAGCIGPAANGDQPTGEEATTDNVMEQINQDLINETDTVEIGEMV